MLDIWQITVTATVIFVATFLQGATGFGFGLIAMALLPLFLPIGAVSMAVPLLLIPLLLVNFAARAKAFEFARAKHLIAAVTIGVPPGVLLLAQVDDTHLKRLLGAVLVIAACHSLLKIKPTSGGNSRSLEWVAGLSCGLLGGAFNTGGPPVIYYLYSKPWPVNQIIATLQVLFLTTAILKLTLGFSSGLIDHATVSIAIIGALPMLVGLIIGIRMSDKFSGNSIRKFVFSCLGLMGIFFLIGL